MRAENRVSFIKLSVNNRVIERLQRVTQNLYLSKDTWTSNNYSFLQRPRKNVTDFFRV